MPPGDIPMAHPDMVIPRRKFLLPIIVLACTSILAFVALIQPWSLRQDELLLKVGDVAQQDLRAPSNIQYVSEVLTGQAKAGSGANCCTGISTA